MFTLKKSPVQSDPDVLNGTLVFRDTRVPVQTLLDYLNDGYTLNEFLQEFPTVRKEDAERFLKLVRDQ